MSRAAKRTPRCWPRSSINERWTEEFDALVEEFTDDKVPGIMRLTNKGAATRADSYERGQLALGFGDTSFRLEVGEIELVKYSYTSSPFGYHIIKRLE